MEKFLSLEKKLGVRFKNRDFLREAMTHRSYLNERRDWPLPHNERLEYLGDAVLELSVTRILFDKFQSAPEGKLTIFRAALVNYQMLSSVAKEFGLGSFILMSKSETKDTGKARDVILANAIEALIGAMYLDAGFETVNAWIKKHIVTRHLDTIISTKSYKDPKSELQELVQEKLRVTPNYNVLEEHGPAHQRTFRVGVYFGDELVGEGRGASKQEGEIDAARSALRSFRRTRS